MFPAETTASAVPSATARTDGDERAVRLRADGLGGLLVHLDHVGRLEQLEPVRLESGRPKSTGTIASVRRLEGTGNDLGRAAIAAHRVDRDADHRGYGRVDAERLDVAALVRAAGRADVVRALRVARTVAQTFTFAAR